MSRSVTAPAGVAVPSGPHAAADATALLIVDAVETGFPIAWANDSAARLLGATPAELRSHDLRTFLPGLAGAQLDGRLNTGRTAQLTMQLTTVRGERLEAVVVAMPEPGGARWTIRVISTTDELERALRATADAHERRFTAVTERSPVPLLLSEQGMRLAHVNEALCALIGVGAEQLLGTGWLRYIDPDDVDGVVEQVTAVLEGSDAMTTLRLHKADGAVRSAVLRLSHLTTPGVGAGFIGTIEDVTERLAFEAQLAHQAHHDPLTGLPNRTLLGRWISDHFQPGAGNLACLFLDLDDFKVVNDSLGHAVGDLLLVQIADRLRAAVRPGDLVARFGGDEFVVVCSGVAESEAVLLAERVVAAVGAPVRLGGMDVRTGVSIGVTVQTAEHHTAEDLVRDCDIAMYQAKAGGKGRVAVLDDRARVAARERLALVADLRDAVAGHGLSVWFQPILAVADGRARSVEALARWDHPGRGTISPDVFIPLAEASGLISELGLFVLDETCRQLAEWDAGLGEAAPERANVNVSALQLDASLPECVASALSRHGVAPSRLSIELTESALMADPAAARELLQQLRDLGVHLAIDDFGTGYSSLAYLRHLPVDCLKVDRSFVAELSTSGNEIAAAVIGLARTLGLSTVAEGVETPEQAAELARLGVTHVQGFLHARPMSGAACSAWFATREDPR